MDDLGWKFWVGFAGLFIAGAVALFVFGLFFLSAVYAWGFLGAFLVLAVAALVAGWILDRREARRHHGYHVGA